MALRLLPMRSKAFFSSEEFASRAILGSARRICFFRVIDVLSVSKKRSWTESSQSRVPLP